MKKNNNFFAGLEDDEEQFEEANFVDQNLDDDGEIEPVITEEDVPEDGKSPDADVVSVEDFDHFFNNDDLGLEDDEDAVVDEGDDSNEAPTVNVSVDIETGDDDDDGEDVGDDDVGDGTDDGASDDVAGEESYDIFGFEDDDPVDQAAEVSDEGEGDDTGAGDETDDGSDDGDDDDISVDVNINVNVDDGTSGDDDDTGTDDGAEEPAANSDEISQEDFDFGTFGLEDDTPEVNVEVTVDGEDQETVTTTDDGDDTETTSDDPVDQAAELSDDGEGSEEPNPEEAGTEEDEDDDAAGEESFFGDLW